uniref:Secreted protein n=1 Tax=Steinernema glaseri TaxID=37863 RepID=A0A1I8AI78_9BILA
MSRLGYFRALKCSKSLCITITIIADHARQRNQKRSVLTNSLLAFDFVEHLLVFHINEEKSIRNCANLFVSPLSALELLICILVR